MWQDLSRAFARDGGDRRAALVGVALVAVFWGIPAVMFLTHHDHRILLMAGLIVAGYSIASIIATLAAFSASRSRPGLEGRTWHRIGIGLALWTAGSMTYLAYLLAGGDPFDPATWSQIGYLAAYPAWYRAMWRLRQPVLASSRRGQFETIAVELAGLLMLALVVGSLLWNPVWSHDRNVSQLIPAILDILLLATFYGAVRRSNLRSNAALTWLGYAFAALALTDFVLTYLVVHEHVKLGGLATTGYVLAMVLVVLAARRPLRVAEVQNRVRSTTGTAAVGGLTIAGLAVVVAPDAIRPFVFVAGALLAWRAFAVIRERDDSDTDVLTGFLDVRAFERHLGGVIQLSSEDRPSLLIAVDLDGFGAWNARNGYANGDALLVEVANALEGAGPNVAAWGRLKADRFALTALSQGPVADRALAEQLRTAAAAAAGPLPARAAIVVLPQDAGSPAEGLDAADEALRAGSEACRPVVAYAAGEMDGIKASPGNASLVIRRKRIQEMLTTNHAIAVHLQPLMTLTDLSVHGYEALSRFSTTPRLAPDQWFAEATALGLGVDLEVHCADRALIRRGEIGDGTWLSINISPEAIVSDDFARIVEELDLTGLVFEITEHERVHNYPRLAARLAALRGRGAQIAIDDTGAGHASLNHLIELKPEFIKLDRGLVSGLDVNSGKHALVRNMLRLADDLGAKLVAEGIETQGELWALRGLGVPLGQGYLLGRPAPYPDGLRSDTDAPIEVSVMPMTGPR